jgi:hypothetical protein
LGVDRYLPDIPSISEEYIFAIAAPSDGVLEGFLYVVIVFEIDETDWNFGSEIGRVASGEVVDEIISFLSVEEFGAIRRSSWSGSKRRKVEIGENSFSFACFEIDRVVVAIAMAIEIPVEFVGFLITAQRKNFLWKDQTVRISAF